MIVVCVGFYTREGDYNSSMETMGHFEPRENPFQTLGEVVGSVQSQEEGARSHLTFKGLCCQSASVTVYLWF